MGSLALSDLFKIESRDDVVSTLLAIASAVELKVTAWQSGQPLRTLIVMVGQKTSDTMQMMAEAAKGGLLDYATGDWLTLLAASLYRVFREDAKAATGPVLSFTNGSTAAKTYTPGNLIVAHAVTGKTYRNVEQITIAPGTTLSGILILADEAGADSSAAQGMITSMVTSATGCTVTNTDAVIGADEESDPAVVTRCRAKLGSLSPNGPKEAYSYVATTPYFPDGTPCAPTSAPITRTQPWLDITTGIGHLYIATASGAPSSQDVAIVDDALVTWAEPWGQHSQADAAVEAVFDVTYQVWIRGSNLTTIQIKNAIATALATYFSTVDIGGDVIPPATTGAVYAESVRTVIATSTRGVVKVALSLPSSDTPLVVGQVPRLGTVTGTVTVIA